MFLKSKFLKKWGSPLILLGGISIVSETSFAQSPQPAPTLPKSGGTDAGGGSLSKSHSYWKDWNSSVIEILDKHQNWAEVAADKSNYSDAFSDLKEGLRLAAATENTHNTRTFLRKSLSWGLGLVEILSDPLIKASVETRFEILWKFYEFLKNEISAFDNECWIQVGVNEDNSLDSETKALFSHVTTLVEAHISWVLTAFFVGTDDRGGVYPRIDGLLYRKLLAGHSRNLAMELLKGGYLFRFQAQDLGKKLEGIALDLEAHNDGVSKPFGGDSKVAIEKSIERLTKVRDAIRIQNEQEKNKYPNEKGGK